MTFLSHIAECFESSFRSLSHYIEKVMRWITYLYLSDKNFESWISIFSHNVEKLMKMKRITILTHSAKFLRVELHFCPTASEKIWGEKQLCLTVPKTLRVELQFCLRMSKKSLRPITNFCHSVEKFKIWLTFLSQIAESFESWIRRLSHYIEEFLRWITYLYLSDEVF